MPYRETWDSAKILPHELKGCLWVKSQKSSYSSDWIQVLEKYNLGHTLEPIRNWGPSERKYSSYDVLAVIMTPYFPNFTVLTLIFTRDWLIILFGCCKTALYCPRATQFWKIKCFDITSDRFRYRCTKNQIWPERYSNHYVIEHKYCRWIVACVINFVFLSNHGVKLFKFMFCRGENLSYLFPGTIK